MEQKNRVAIYIRVSTAYQIDKDSLPMQRSDLINYSKLILNTDDYVVFEDAGYSGKNTDRPQYQEMMAQIRQKKFTHLLVWKLDRISRNLLNFAEMYTELKNLGVTFVSKNEQFDTSTAMGEAMLKIILVFAELERNITSERVSATMVSRASNGLWNGGPVPYGYNYDSKKRELSINEDEMLTVKLMHDKYEEMRSIVALTRFLNETHHFTRDAKPWGLTSIDRILSSKFYSGEYRYNKLKVRSVITVRDKSEWVIVENHHPAIISKEQKDRVLKILSDNNRIHSEGIRTTTKHISVFHGKLICSECGKRYSSSGVKKYADFDCSRYVCYGTRLIKHQEKVKVITDLYLGEFVFNFILNILNAKKNKDEIADLSDLQHFLLLGSVFNDISALDDYGLNELWNVVGTCDSAIDMFGKTELAKGSTKPSELPALKNDRAKANRALSRLTSLFLYSDDAMSESEFIIQKSQLVERIDELDNQIQALEDEFGEQSVSDDEFLKRAGEFIISQKLSGKKYVNYRLLAASVDASVLNTFIDSVIEAITISKGKIVNITFLNGLSVEFLYS